MREVFGKCPICRGMTCCFGGCVCTPDHGTEDMAAGGVVRLGDDAVERSEHAAPCYGDRTALHSEVPRITALAASTGARHAPRGPGTDDALPPSNCPLCSSIP